MFKKEVIAVLWEAVGDYFFLLFMAAMTTPITVASTRVY